jgi:hypothetical protein
MGTGVRSLTVPLASWCVQPRHVRAGACAVLSALLNFCRAGVCRSLSGCCHMMVSISPSRWLSQQPQQHYLYQVRTPLGGDGLSSIHQA